MHYETQQWVEEHIMMYYALAKYHESRKKFSMAEDSMKSVKHERRKLQQITKRSVIVEEIGWGITYGFAGKYDDKGLPLLSEIILEQAKEKGLKTRPYFYIKIEYGE